MTANDLRVLYEYDAWGSGKLFQAIRQLTPEQFTQPVAGAYGSIRNTMVHVLSAEWGWIDRCGGPQRGARLNAADYPTVASLTQLRNVVEQHVGTFLPTLTDERLRSLVEYDFGQGPQTASVGELLHHGAVHAVHHRGQVAVLLRSIGIVPGNFDMLFFYAERRALAVEHPTEN